MYQIKKSYRKHNILQRILKKYYYCFSPLCSSLCVLKPTCGGLLEHNRITLGRKVGL